MCIYIYTYIHVCISISLYTHVYIHIYIYFYIYVCVYVFGFCVFSLSLSLSPRSPLLSMLASRLSPCHVWSWQPVVDSSGVPLCYFKACLNLKFREASCQNPGCSPAPKPNGACPGTPILTIAQSSYHLEKRTSEPNNTGFPLAKSNPLKARDHFRRIAALQEISQGLLQHFSHTTLLHFSHTPLGLLRIELCMHSSHALSMYCPTSEAGEEEQGAGLFRGRGFLFQASRSLGW